MSERREPTISPINVSGESLEPEKRAVKTRSGRRPPPVSNRPVVVRSGVAWFSLILVLVSFAAVGYVGMMLINAQKTIDQQGGLLQQAGERIQALEDKLALSDDESSQNITVIQAKVKENASEIRKLWGVSYDTNRKSIATLQGDLATLAKKSVAEDKKIEKSITEISGELTVLSELMNAQQAIIQQVSRSFQSDEQNISKLKQDFEQLQTQFEKRIKMNEEAIQAIDAFRVQVNRDLLQLKGG